MLIRMNAPNTLMKHMSLFQNCQPGSQASGSYSGVPKVMRLLNRSWGLKSSLSGSREYSPHQSVFQGQASKFPFCLDLPLFLPEMVPWELREVLSPGQPGPVQLPFSSLLPSSLLFSFALNSFHLWRDSFSWFSLSAWVYMADASWTWPQRNWFLIKLIVSLPQGGPSLHDTILDQVSLTRVALLITPVSWWLPNTPGITPQLEYVGQPLLH